MLDNVTIFSVNPAGGQMAALGEVTQMYNLTVVGVDSGTPPLAGGATIQILTAGVNTCHWHRVCVCVRVLQVADFPFLMTLLGRCLVEVLPLVDKPFQNYAVSTEIFCCVCVCVHERVSVCVCVTLTLSHSPSDYSQSAPDGPDPSQSLTVALRPHPPTPPFCPTLHLSLPCWTNWPTTMQSHLAALS